MEKKTNSRLRTALCCTGFIALFLAIFTLLTLVFVPKWRGLDAEEMRGLYQEEENSIDLLLLGSCNIYSSFSPVIAYEQYGITSYVFACPDQELCISYHYLKEALKNQDIKTVVLETLFLTCEPTAKREYYNRTALEYMPMSTNKAQLIFALGAAESEYMQTVDPSAPGKLLTYAGYFCPLLRYHGREDITMDDVEFYLDRDDYSMRKGGKPLFSYLRNETVDFDYVLNGEAIRDTSREYFIKLQELCEEEGIDLVLAKSPNHYRWDDAATAAVHAFAEERNVPLVDFFDYDDFIVSDYSDTTGRLNVYGMKRFTEHLCEYLSENELIAPAQLSAENKAKWDECVENLHATANKKEMTIDEGQIYRVMNETEGVRLLWNRCLDGTSYSVFRYTGVGEKYEKLATVSDCTYLDTDVEHGQSCLYYIVPEDGVLRGQESEKKHIVFVQAPAAGSAQNSDGAVQLAWEAVEDADNYRIERKKWSDLNYSYWDNYDEKTTYKNMDCESGTLYSYRIFAEMEADGETYRSGALVVEAIPMDTPQITTVSAKSGANTIQWNKLSSGGDIQIYRRAEDEKEFALYDTVSSKKTSYKDEDVKKGVEYFYKLVNTKTVLDEKGSSFASNTVGVVARG